MKRTGIRARVAVGTALVALAGFAVAGSLSAAPESAPPSTSPGSSEPLETAAGSSPTALDPEREALVDEIVASAGDAGFPVDRDCVAGLVAQVPEEDLELLGEQIAGVEETAVATAVTMPEYTTDSGPADSAPDESVVTETAPAETVAVGSVPALSPETEALGEQMVLCAHGDADPALVAEAFAVIEADPEAPAFDMACVASVLTTFSDETLTLIIEDTDVAVPFETAAGATIAVETVVPATATDSAPDSAGSEPELTDGTEFVVDEPLGSIPDEALSEAFTLLVCAPEFLDELDSMGADIATASVPDPVTETEAATAETAAGAPTESTTG